VCRRGLLADSCRASRGLVCVLVGGLLDGDTSWLLYSARSNSRMISNARLLLARVPLTACTTR
jgi:hypothetical protein